MTGTVQDITDYKRAESAWRDSETRMRSISSARSKASSSIDDRGQIETANAALLTIGL